jgi:protein KTI12
LIQVHCGTPINLARQWNSEKGEGGYPEDVYVSTFVCKTTREIDQLAYTCFRFQELITRYEEPDGRNRWDSPLFTVIYDDPSVPQDKLWDAVILKKPPPPNLSTITVS